MSKSDLPLGGITVADFSQGVAGPYAGLLMALQGARVIKVEPPIGDWSRRLGTPYGDLSPYNIYFNRGKQSIVLDFKTTEGLRGARQLADKADVVIEAFRPGIMKRYGLDYETLSNRKKDLIYLSVTGFGQSGKNSDLPATDAVIQGFSGLMSLNKDSEGIPQRFPMILIDVVSGMYGYQAIMAALLGKFRYGQGKYIDCSLMHSAVAFQASALTVHEMEGGRPPIMYVPLGVMRTSDGFISISVHRDNHFAAFCKALADESLANDLRYVTVADRIKHEDILMPIVRKALQERSTAEWVERFTKEGVLHSVVRSHDDVLADDDLLNFKYLESITQSGIGRSIKIANVPGALLANELGSLNSAPHLGEHTETLRKEFGI